MEIHPITCDDGTPDRRYSIQREFCGYPEKRHVLRFCGDFIAQSTSYSAMVLRGVGHKAVLHGATIIEGV